MPGANGPYTVGGPTDGDAFAASAGVVVIPPLQGGTELPRWVVIQPRGSAIAGVKTGLVGDAITSLNDGLILDRDAGDLVLHIPAGHTHIHHWGGGNGTIVMTPLSQKPGVVVSYNVGGATTEITTVAATNVATALPVLNNGSRAHWYVVQSRSNAATNVSTGLVGDVMTATNQGPHVDGLSGDLVLHVNPAHTHIHVFDGTSDRVLCVTPLGQNPST